MNNLNPAAPSEDKEVSKPSWLDSPRSPQPFIPDVFSEKEQRQYDTQQEAQEEAREASSSWGDAASAAFESTQIAPLLYRQLSRDDLADDPSFSLTKDIFKEHVQQEIPEEFWDEFDPSEIRSMGQLNQLKEEIKETLERTQLANSKGLAAGIGLSVGAAILDPVAWGVAVGTEGVLAPAIFAGKVSRTTRAIRGGLLASAGTAPVEGYFAYADPTYDLSDAFIGMAGAGALGALVGGVSRSYDAPLEHLKVVAEAAEAHQDGLKATAKGQAIYKELTGPDGSFKSPREVNEDFFANHKGHKTWAAKLRLDRAADTFSEASEKIRGLAGALFEDPVAEKGALVKESAMLNKERHFGRLKRTYLKGQKQNLSAFMQENGQGWSKTREARRSFNEQVTYALRGMEVSSEAVKKQAAEVRRMYDELASTARKHGVKGAEDMKLEDYVNRRWSVSKIDALDERLGPGSAARLIAASIRGMSPEHATTVAESLVALTRRSRQGTLDVQSLSGKGEHLASFLKREHGLTDSEATNIAASIRRLTEGADAGRAGNLKHRLNIDEAMVKDLLENDIDLLFTSYANSMTGHIALAKQGIDSEDTFQRLLQEARADMEANPAKGTLEAKKRQRAARNIEEAYHHIVGRPTVENPHDLGATAGRLVRKLNFSRLMNMVGIAQIAEFGVMASHVGYVNMLRNMPELLKIHRKLKSGNFSDELVEELSDAMGGWADYRVLHRSAQRIEEFGDADGLRKSRLAQAEGLLDEMNHITTDISGFNYINQVLHSYAMKSMAQTFLDAARKKGNKHILGDARLRELGIDSAMLKRINEHLMAKGNASWNASGKLNKLNLERWDEEVREAFGAAMRRWGNQIIQEPDFGSVPRFMQTTVGKLLFQFKTFMTVSYSKQVLNNIKHRDRTSVMMLFNTTFAGALSYLAYVGISAQGREDSDKKRYLDKMLAPEQIATGAFQRSSISTFFPGLWDSTVPMLFGVDPLFDTRASGLQSSFINGAATVDFSTKLYSATSETAEAIRDGEFTSNTARSWASILPFTNAIGIRNALNALYGELPEDYD